MGLDMMIYNSSDTEVAYWRKANQIHNWFCENLEGDVENCGRTEVSREKMIELVNLCEEVLEKRDTEFNEEHLPTSSGFFFGTTEYDEWYYKDLENTIKQLNAILENEKDAVFYCPWW
jgi:hypothetical protein